MTSTRPPAEPPPMITPNQHNQRSPNHQVTLKRRFNKPPDISYHPRPSYRDPSRSPSALQQVPMSPATKTAPAPKHITLSHNNPQVNNNYCLDSTPAKPRYRISKPAWTISYTASQSPMKTWPSNTTSQDSQRLPNRKEANTQPNQDKPAANKFDFSPLRHALQELFDQQLKQLLEVTKTMDRIRQLMYHTICAQCSILGYKDYWPIYNTRVQ
eukprot:15366680-Ditylum_brightwellii.AAC.1